MKKILLIAIAATYSLLCYAQSQIFRTEFTVYDTRETALTRDHSHTRRYHVFAPKEMGVLGEIQLYGSTLDFPTSWSDYDIFLHIENVPRSYDLAVNDILVAKNDDWATPATYSISKQLKQGENHIVLLLRHSEAEKIDIDTPHSKRDLFHGCYIFAQHKVHIHDYQAQIIPDSEGYPTLNIDVAVANNFNYTEPVEVGYDVYGPNGKLIDYGAKEGSVAGRSIDTLKIATRVGDTDKTLWSAKSPNLYKVMLFVKKGGKPTEYLPIEVAAGKTEFDGTQIRRNGEPIALKIKRYTTTTTYYNTDKEVQNLRTEGYNTLLTTHPQPEWFYRICERRGMYVIESANINPNCDTDDRKIGGTPSNDPTLCEKYLERVKSMYYRTQNRPCIIGYNISGEKAGNGYCLYKSYQYLKERVSNLPIICLSAAGEWNNDLDIIQ